MNHLLSVLTLSVQGETRFSGASRGIESGVGKAAGRRLAGGQAEDENTDCVAFKPRQAYCPLYTEGYTYCLGLTPILRLNVRLKCARLS